MPSLLVNQLLDPKPSCGPIFGAGGNTSIPKEWPSAERVKPEATPDQNTATSGSVPARKSASECSEKIQLVMIIGAFSTEQTDAR